MNLLLLILLIVCLGGLPQLGWHEAGYWPSGGAGVLLLILVILLLAGRL